MLYTACVLMVSDEQRQYLDLDGAPLPLIDPDQGRGYMLMPVDFTRSPGGRVFARVRGVRAVGEANEPTEALGTLAVLLRKIQE